MKKLLLIEKEAYSETRHTIKEFDTIDEIIEQYEGDLKDKIIAKTMKLKYLLTSVEQEEEEELKLKLEKDKKDVKAEEGNE